MTLTRNGLGHDATLAAVSPNPFDQIRRTWPDQSEYWSARDLMPLLGYGAWREFKVPLARAMKAAENQGSPLTSNFGRSPKITATKPMEDFELSRFAAYLVAMNGDPNKLEVAAAQHYFAIRTREAEIGVVRPQTAVSLAAAEVNSAIERLRLCRAAQALIAPAEFERRVSHVLDRGLDMALVSRPDPNAPLAPAQFLLEKGLSHLDAEVFSTTFSPAVAKASRRLTGRSPRLQSGVKGESASRQIYAFTEVDRPVMETVWKSMGITVFRDSRFPDSRLIE